MPVGRGQTRDQRADDVYNSDDSPLSGTKPKKKKREDQISKRKSRGIPLKANLRVVRVPGSLLGPGHW